MRVPSSKISGCSSPKQPSPPTLKHANTFIDTLLRTLCRSEKTQLLCNQANPNSFDKTPGVRVSLRKLRSLSDSALTFFSYFVSPLFSWSYKLLFSQPVCFDNYLRCPPGVPHPALNFPTPRRFDFPFARRVQ